MYVRCAVRLRASVAGHAVEVNQRVGKPFTASRGADRVEETTEGLDVLRRARTLNPESINVICGSVWN